MAINVMSTVLRDPTLDGKRKLILLAIADATDRDGLGFCSYAQIRQVTDVTDEYLRRVIASFVAEGRLQIMQKGTGPGRATVYQVITPSTRHNSPTELPSSVEELPNSVAQNPPTQLQGTPQLDSVDSPTQLQGTPQLGPVNSPTGAPNPPSFTPLQAPPLQTPPTDADRFEDFWSTYPRRSGKRAARAAWTAATRRAPTTDILTGAARYRDDPNRLPQFTALPATWLNQDRWDDDPLPARITLNPRQQHANDVMAFAAAKQARLEQLGIA